MSLTFVHWCVILGMVNAKQAALACIPCQQEACCLQQPVDLKFKAVIRRYKFNEPVLCNLYMNNFILARQVEHVGDMRLHNPGLV